MWTFLSSTPTLHCDEDAWLKGEGLLSHTLMHTYTLPHTHKHMLPQRSAQEAASSCPGLTESAPPRAWCWAALQGEEERTLQTGAGLSAASSSTPQQSHSDPRSPGDPQGSGRTPSQGPQLAAGVWAGPLLCPSRSVDTPLTSTPPPDLHSRPPGSPPAPPQNLLHREWAAVGGKRSTRDPLRAGSCSGTFLKV